MIVDGAGLATEPPNDVYARLGFSHARTFQNRTAEWVQSDNAAPVAVLRAPTGAGKTAAFHSIIEENNLTLVVYPTNALLNQQISRFEANGVSVAPLTGNTLSGHGDDRVEEILSFTDRYSGHDIVVTNPDILQSIIQNTYHGTTKAMQFYDRFDAVIYDEFHFYDPLAASGLLLQIHIFLDRRPTADIVLASATPNESFVSFVTDELAHSVRDIDVVFDDAGDRFRQPVTVKRHETRTIDEEIDAVIDRLRELITSADDLQTPQVALVFNSVAASNDFHQTLSDVAPEVFKHTVKDNGFDTNDPDVDLETESYFILNTTSKGEVGLDHDIQTLFMETPRSPSSFLQRFGRAGREHEATVHVYGLKEISWPETMAYRDFVSSIYNRVGDGPTADSEISQLRSLIGLRAAYALQDRMDAPEWMGEELRADFESAPEFDRWRGFIRSLDTTLKKAGEFGSPITRNSPTRKMLTFTRHCLGAFRGLRGRSLSIDIEYPRGDRKALTSYDLLTALRYYDIESITSDGTPRLRRRDTDQPVAITGRVPGYENRPKDYSGSRATLQDQFNKWLYPEIDMADLEQTRVDEGLLRRFISVLPLPKAVLPIEVRYDRYVAYVEQDGIPSVTVERRNI
ncbi:type I-D CRISPR-associated helicase Cas3' [Halocatena salina]|uniref:Type I-D CRISPR-associated helicase Cas3 n=1 Tax=Halocatena salina TaxID=2934340 RepID=A0A8U0A7U3_9EURY|nr:type I-D CRISPR-associated helicase Cas3' [Halocatena salina]UPM45260.1 type I-D CRISPR-associated helicase Cas3' [Halocatena salina]